MTGLKALFAQSNVAIGAGELEIAERLLRQALEMDPDCAEVHANLAWLLDRKGAVSDAVRHYEQALDLQPMNARIHLNFGALLLQQQHHQAAELAYQSALAIDPAMAGGWSNLGLLQALTNRDAQAEQSFLRALELDGSHGAAHFNLACLLLRKGRLAEGWRHFESRDWYQAIEHKLGCPRLQAQALAGQSILVVYEVGYGDMIQFCRYATLMKAAGAGRVELLCHPPLKSLLQTLEGVDRVFGFDEVPSGVHWDLWVPMMSLPLYFDTQMDSIPASNPYLRAPADRAAHWRAEVRTRCPGHLLRVGLVWHGNPLFANDEDRSLPSLRTLAPLWGVPGVRFFSLQKGRGEQEIGSCQQEQPLDDLAPDLHDFADTAAAIEQLDLVISVDTAVAHLAGALGKPCWLMLPAYMTDWRWLEDRGDTPWYPGAMRLFRQRYRWMWEPVVGDVRDALQAVAPQSGKYSGSTV